MSDLNSIKKDILNLVKEYVREKNSIEWDKDKDWVEYSGPTFDEDEYVAAIDTLLAGWFIMGKDSREFELEFPKYLGKSDGVLTNSGSSANLLMLAVAAAKRGYNLPKGSGIITPVVCFPTTVNPIIQNGFKPVFVDVDLPSLNLNLDEVEYLLEMDPSIRGITFAHVLGNPPDMDRLMRLVEKHNLIFFEDACDALGSYYDGKKLGSFGHMSTCSFFPAHHMTLGEGGFVATSDKKARKVLASMRDWGRACYCNTMKPGSVTQGTACGNRFRKWLPGMKNAVYDHRYVFDEIGYNLKPLELQASIGLQQIKKLPVLDDARRKNHSRLNEIFGKYEKYFYLPSATEKADPCWFGYLLTIREDAPFSKDKLVRYLEGKRIQTRSYFSGNILAHPGYTHLATPYKNINKRFPNAALVTTNSLFLGTFKGITEEKLNYISEVVDSFMNSYS
tara:strand:+ start:55 stop:1398 length:1344 start_codon:yes stop_codon:yes gene_type:complete